MNQWWIIFCLGVLTVAGFTGERYGENRIKVQCDKHDEAQQQVTIAAQNHVINEVKNQNQITQGAENDYQQNITAITGLYSHGLQPDAAAASASMRAISGTACSAQASKRYKLTPQKCDDEEAKCNVLWNWAQRQSKIK